MATSPMPNPKPIPRTTVTSEQVALSVAELVARWRGQVRPSTLASWRTKGIGPRYLKLGGRVLYPVIAVEEFEAASTKG